MKENEKEIRLKSFQAQLFEGLVNSYVNKHMNSLCKLSLGIAMRDSMKVRVIECLQTCLLKHII